MSIYYEDNGSLLLDSIVASMPLPQLEVARVHRRCPIQPASRSIAPPVDTHKRSSGCTSTVTR
jgi:hypothetical protein